MKNKKDIRIGEIRKNKQGLTMQIVDYRNNKNVVIEFLETGERRKTTYLNFTKGTPSANLMEHPSRTECSFRHAVWIAAGILALIIAAIIGLTYWIVK